MREAKEVVSLSVVISIYIILKMYFTRRYNSQEKRRPGKKNENNKRRRRNPKLPFLDTIKKNLAYPLFGT